MFYMVSFWKVAEITLRNSIIMLLQKMLEFGVKVEKQ